MKQLKAVINYGCATSLKYCGMFYATEYGAILPIMVLFYFIFSDDKTVRFPLDCLEMNSIVFLMIFAGIGFYNDFKMLLQNGFIRKYILISNVSTFIIVEFVMSCIDTVIGNGLYHISDYEYMSIFLEIYGNQPFILFKIFWLCGIYSMAMSLVYFCTCITYKVGKKMGIYIVITISLLLTIIMPPLINSGTSNANALDIVKKIGKFMIKLGGFVENGTINLFYPILTFAVFASIFYLTSYVVIRKTELKS